MTVKSAFVNEGHRWCPSNPHTHMNLFGDPSGGAEPRCMAGTLRPLHQQHANSAAAFARSKINPLAGSDRTDWTLVAHRAEVILPRHAEDRFSCPRTLFEAVDTEHPADGKALLTYVTLIWRPERLHHQWELGRKLAVGLAREHDVAVLLAHHVPSKIARTTSPHLHIAIAGPRRFDPWGLGSYVPTLMGDRVWMLMRERFRTLLDEMADKTLCNRLK